MHFVLYSPYDWNYTWYSYKAPHEGAVIQIIEVCSVSHTTQNGNTKPTQLPNQSTDYNPDKSMSLEWR